MLEDNVEFSFRLITNSRERDNTTSRSYTYRFYHLDRDQHIQPLFSRGQFHVLAVLKLLHRRSVSPERGNQNSRKGKGQFILALAGPFADFMHVPFRAKVI